MIEVGELVCFTKAHLDLTQHIGGLVIIRVHNHHVHILKWRLDIVGELDNGEGVNNSFDSINEAILLLRVQGRPNNIILLISSMPILIILFIFTYLFL